MTQPFGTKVIRGITLREDPAREPCFTVVQDSAELLDYDDMSPVSRRQRLHKHMHNEMQSIEMSAQSLADFPDAPWGLRMCLARQCWDESRHSRLLYRRLCQVGGQKGEFPVMNYEWSVTCMIDTIAGRMALQNRTFEGGEMDLLRKLVTMWRDAGDEDTAELLEGILADEIQHVRFANEWIKLMSAEDRSSLMRLAGAINFLRKVTVALEPEEGQTNLAGINLTGYTHVELMTNVEDRRLAGFSEAEIAEVERREKELAESSPAGAAAVAR